MASASFGYGRAGTPLARAGSAGIYSGLLVSRMFHVTMATERAELTIIYLDRP